MDHLRQSWIRTRPLQSKQEGQRVVFFNRAFPNQAVRHQQQNNRCPHLWLRWWGWKWEGSSVLKWGGKGTAALSCVRPHLGWAVLSGLRDAEGMTEVSKNKTKHTLLGLGFVVLNLVQFAGKNKRITMSFLEESCYFLCNSLWGPQRKLWQGPSPI